MVEGIASRALLTNSMEELLISAKLKAWTLVIAAAAARRTV